MDNTSEQPNFARAADALNVLAREVQLCPNIQAVQDAATLNRIVIELGALRRTMEARFDAVDARLDTVDARLDALERSTKVSLHNAPALVYNSHIRHQGMKLAPLYSPVTGEIVEATSLTLEEIDAMTVGRVNDLLTQLGLSLRGNAPVKKQRLKFALGVVQSAPPQER